MPISTKINAIVIDDEQDAINSLKILLSDFESIDIIGEFLFVNSAVDYIIEAKPDLIFLDVDMPEKNGFDLVSELRNLRINSTIIFVTAYSEYAISAIEEDVFGYLLKPVDPDKLRKLINKYRAKFKNDDTPYKNKIRFSTRTGFILISPNDIVYCKADGSYTEIHLKSERTVTISQNLKHAGSLLYPAEFFKVGRSFIIRRSLIYEIDTKQSFCFLEINGEIVKLKIPRKSLLQLKRDIEK